MLRLRFILSSKVSILLVISSIIIIGCSSLTIEVWLSNQSQDNLNLDNVYHIAPGERTLIGFLSKDNKESNSIDIYRSNTRLATVTYTGELWPDQEKGETSYKDEVVIEEPGERNKFTAYSLLDVVSVSITHHN